MLLKNFDGLQAYFEAPGKLQGAGVLSAMHQQAYADDLRIGSRIFGCIDAACSINDKKGEIRPLIVTGLWRVDGILKKIEAYKVTTKSKRFHADDFPINSDRLVSAFHSARKEFISPSTVYILNNTIENFPNFYRKPPLIDPVFFPDILVRRAYSLMYNPAQQTWIEGDVADLKREGFVFEEIPETAIRAKADFVSDIPNHQFTSVASDIIDQTIVNCIGKFAASFTGWHTLVSNVPEFPPFEEWPLNMDPLSYPDWSKDWGKDMPLQHLLP